jgi:hypothetical protein
MDKIILLISAGAFFLAALIATFGVASPASAFLGNAWAGVMCARWALHTCERSK